MSSSLMIGKEEKGEALRFQVIPCRQQGLPRLITEAILDPISGLCQSFNKVSKVSSVEMLYLIGSQGNITLPFLRNCIDKRLALFF